MSAFLKTVAERGHNAIGDMLLEAGAVQRQDKDLCLTTRNGRKGGSGGVAGQWGQWS